MNFLPRYIRLWKRGTCKPWFWATSLKKATYLLIHRPMQAGKCYVLVHGAYQGAWCWKSVARGLRALGHDVYAPTWTGLGERSHLLAAQPSLETFIQDVAQVLTYEDLTDVILVGHSFAGSVVSALADRMRDRLRHLVYLDALLLRSGESSAERSPERIAGYRQRALEFSGGLTIPPVAARHFGISDPERAAWLQGKLTPTPLQPYYDKLYLEHSLGNGLPATYIACTNPYFPNTVKSREIARENVSWSYLEIPTGHNAMTLLPEALIPMLAAID